LRPRSGTTENYPSRGQLRMDCAFDEPKHPDIRNFVPVYSELWGYSESGCLCTRRFGYGCDKEAQRRFKAVNPIEQRPGSAPRPKELRLIQSWEYANPDCSLRFPIYNFQNYARRTKIGAAQFTGRGTNGIREWDTSTAAPRDATRASSDLSRLADAWGRKKSDDSGTVDEVA